MAAMANNTPSRPDPDPTVLTTANLLREIASLKELFDAKVAALDDRIAGLHAHIDSLPHDREAHITSLKEWVIQRFAVIDEKFSTVNEKFGTVHTQFSERDVRVEQSAKDTKTAIDAALSAQEKAFQNQNQNFVQSIAKSETATIKTIDQQGMLLATSTAGLNDKIDDLKARITRIESQVVGAHEAIADQRSSGTSNTNTVAVIAAIALGSMSLIITAYHVFHVPAL